MAQPTAAHLRCPRTEAARLVPPRRREATIMPSPAKSLYLQEDRIGRPRHGQTLPEIHILHGLFVGFDPVFFLPAPEPALGNSMTDILRIRIQGHGAGFAQGLQRPQHRLELHAVVGRQPRSTGEFPAMGRSVQPQNGRPTSRARIAETGSVRINGDISHSAVHTARKDV